MQPPSPFDPVAAARAIRQGRDDRTLYLAEGIKTIRDLLEAGAKAVGAVATNSETGSELSPREKLRHLLVDRLTKDGHPVAIVSPKAFGRLTQTRTPQGLLLLARRRTESPDGLLGARNATVLYLDSIQDPANAGALVRVAAALGASHVIRGTATADLYGEKAVRAAAGCQERIPLLDDRSFDLVTKLKRAGFEFVASDNRQGDLPGVVQPRDRIVLVVSSEGSGLSARFDPFVSARIRIPLGRGVESLNVAAAAAIILAAWARLPADQKPAASPS